MFVQLLFPALGQVSIDISKLVQGTHQVMAVFIPVKEGGGGGEGLNLEQKIVAKGQSLSSDPLSGGPLIMSSHFPIVGGGQRP